MSANSFSFMDQLKESGLLADEQLAEVRGRIAADSVENCISGLMQRGWLTEFQVQQLHAGQSKGLVLGQYHILEELGRGGYGCVYKARHKLMERIVALKVMAPDLVADPRARTWFRREVLAATHLNHPNIALAYDANEVNDILFFAMEYVDGLNLDSLVRQRGPLPIGMACELMHQTAKALQYAQEKGMVHRDVKPANLLIPRSAVSDVMADLAPVTGNGTRPVLVKVVDFGLARLHKTSSNHTLQLQNEKSFVGTPAYVSPEQARNVHDVDIRSDLYSLGCTMYFAIAGHPPFQADTPLQLIVQHLEKEPEALERARPEIPPALASIVRRLMEKKREKRFQTPAELIAELGFFYNNAGPAPSNAAPFLRAERAILAAPPSARLPIPDFLPIPASSADKSLDATKVVPGLASDLPQPSGETAKTAAIDRSDNAAAVERHQATQVEPFANPSLEIDRSQPIATVREGVAEVPIAANAALIDAWRRWMAVITGMTSARSPDLSGAAYRELHRRLVAQCEALRTSADAGQRLLAEKMLDVVRPWVSLESLPAADRATLGSLHARCLQIDRLLGHTSHSVWIWAGAFLVLICLFIVGRLALEHVADLRVANLTAFVQSHPFVSLAGIVPVVVALSFFFVKRGRS